MEPQELTFQLSDENEQVVRTYKCTNLKRWFIPPTIGYLTITNRRVVFHSSGKSLTGKSILINEMPLEDVAGLSVYEGLSFNLLFFLLFAVATYFVTRFIAFSLPPFFTSYWLVALLMLPHVVVWIVSSNVLNAQIKEQIFDRIDGVFQDRFKINRDWSDYLRHTRTPLLIGLVILGWRIAFTTTFGLRTPLVGWILILVIYGYIFLNMAGRTHTFTLQIGSKTMKDSGIYIPGDSLSLFSGKYTTAFQGLGGSPAEDAGQVIRELGALIMDMQQLGDQGMEKWKQ